MITNQRDEFLTTAEAAARLEIKPATLYAYVSRGVVEAHRHPGSRESYFRAADIERLRARSRGGGPGLAIESAITLIRPDGHFYRGLAARELATSRTFEQVAEWLWGDAMPDRAVWSVPAAFREVGVAAQSRLPDTALPLERLAVIAAAVATADELRFETSPESARTAGRSLIAGLAACLPRLGPEPGRTRIAGTPAPGAVAGVLWSRLSQRRPTGGMLAVLNAALVLLADHELSASAVAARIAASVRANPYAVVSAGLGVVQGPLHGGAALTVEELFRGVRSPDQARRAVGERLRRGEPLFGFGLPLYPEGDPRAAVVLALLRATARRSRRLAAVEAVLDLAQNRGLPPPTIEFALAAVTHVGGLTAGAGEAIFAVARSAGWIAHAIEEYERRTRFRLRALYTGPAPSEPKPTPPSA